MAGITCCACPPHAHPLQGHRTHSLGTAATVAPGCTRRGSQAVCMLAAQVPWVQGCSLVQEFAQRCLDVPTLALTPGPLRTSA